MLVIHHLGDSQSDRIIWLCEELAIPYQLERYERDPVSRVAPARYKALHPMGTAPVIFDANRVLAESDAIVEYIIAKHGGGRLAVTPDEPNFAEYLYWFHFANGSLMPASFERWVITHLGGTKGDPTLQSVLDREANAFQMIEKRLGKADYFAGDAFTAADIMMFFPMTVMRKFVSRDLSNSPHTRAYLKRIGARPAYQQAMAKGDPGLPLNLE